MSLKAMRQAEKVMGLIAADLICTVAHHSKKDQHDFFSPCPIQQRWHEAFDTLRAEIAKARGEK
jgi:hypothetical protein